METETDDALPRPAAGARQRIQVDLNAEGLRRLREIKELSDDKTNAEVFKHALAVYEWVLKHRREGSRIQIAQGDRVHELSVLF